MDSTIEAAKLRFDEGLVPEASTDEHLQILAQAAELFSDPAVRTRLREAASSDEVPALFGNVTPAA